jgi:hypothetical protein
MPSEQEIRQAIATADQALAAARQSPYPPDLFPELSRGARPAAATSALVTAPAPPQQVERRAPVNAQHLRPLPVVQVEVTPEAVRAGRPSSASPHPPRPLGSPRAND